MNNAKISVSFENRILSVTYLDNAIVDIPDLQEIYRFATSRAAGKSYCVVFEALNHYEVTEEAVQYMADNPANKHILAKAYVVNTKESNLKTKLHLTFDKPALKPNVFETNKEAINWLNTLLEKDK
jgi:hypothetical protein